ncbi:MAG TPA: helix-turn-helix domain-containing protein [Haliangiales bacterium]|nr:helix-turn-helix domain-containing protein [Haliangiales bacterium]
MPIDESSLVTVEAAGKLLGVSSSTVWRMIRRGTLPSVRERGRRLVPTRALEKRALARQSDRIPPLLPDAPIFRLVGAGHGGGGPPGARDKHALIGRK